jgi:hypothetical protein
MRITVVAHPTKRDSASQGLRARIRAVSFLDSMFPPLAKPNNQLSRRAG